VLHERTSFNRAGIAIAIGLDVSKSMLAEDVELPSEGRELFHIPNRLNRARYLALQFLSELQGERLGLYLFASKGVEIIPFTNDYGYSQYIVRHVNDSDITTSGSDLGEAILYGISMYEESSSQQVKRIILLSDGEDISIDQSRLYEAAEIAASKGIKIDTVGIGTGKAMLIPIRNVDTTSIVDYYLDEDGTYLRTSLVQETLEKIAHISGGHSFHITDEQVARKLLESILSDVKTIERTRSIELVWMDLSPLFLLSAMGFFIIGVFVNN
jgi:Ca-activated chloride channel family protein